MFIVVLFFFFYLFIVFFFFFNDTATTEIYTLSLHDALPIWGKDDVDDKNDTNHGNLPFEETYSLQVFQVRGEQCVALKVYPYKEYQLFAIRENDDG